MSIPLNRVIAGAAVAAIAVAVVLAVRLTDRQDAAQWAQIQRPTQVAATQPLDLKPMDTQGTANSSPKA